MTPKHRFRPSVDDALESRIALSHAGGVAEVAAQATALSITVHGTSRTTLPNAPGSPEFVVLNGSTRIRGLGNVKFQGVFGTNASLPGATTTGSAQATLRGRVGGTLAADFAGPTTDLAPRTATTTPFNFHVVTASGAFSSLAGTDGTAALTLRSGPAHRGVARGQFTLTLSEG
ncbi:MAG TPA: hypothetical protein VG406_00835 [Isosphaeraceae bacterium]|nr:hypothetical protein [Isosphaeraceae bacterium]